MTLIGYRALRLLAISTPRTEGNGHNRTAVLRPCSCSAPDGQPSTSHLLSREVSLPQPHLRGQTGWEAHRAKNCPPTALRQGETSAHAGDGPGPPIQAHQLPVTGTAGSPGACSG